MKQTAHLDNQQSKQSSILITTGRRKTAAARAFLHVDSDKQVGRFIVNHLDLDDYFARKTDRMIARQPLDLIGAGAAQFDIYVTVKSGGSTGQAGAVRLALTRALIQYEQTHRSAEISVAELDLQHNTLAQEGNSDESEGDSGAATHSWKKMLRQAGFVTRDSRKVERKKVGRHKARKGVQFSKR